MSRQEIVSLILILIVGLSLRQLLLTSDNERLIKIIPDDAFYYIETAQHISSGDGSTFDGINPTNGYHPLWMLLIIPIVSLISDPWMLTRAVLSLGLLANIGSALFLFAALRRWFADLWFIPIIGVAIYYLNAQNITSSLNGLETMLSSLFFTASLYLISSGLKSGFGSRQSIQLGLTLGLLFLSRTDNAFYILGFFLLAMLAMNREQRWSGLAILGVVSAATITPWLLWNYFSFGSIIQGSGFAVPYVLRDSFLSRGYDNGTATIKGLRLFAAFAGDRLWRSCLGIPTWLVYPTLAWIGYRLWQSRNDLKIGRSPIITLITLSAGAICLIFVHTFLRWYPRDYYFDQIAILTAVAVSLAVWLTSQTEWWQGKVKLTGQTILILLILISAARTTNELYSRGEYPHQVEMLDTAHWLQENTPEKARLAAFNVGIISFFSDRQSINLDGAINNAAFEAIKRHRLLEYVQLMEVDYLADYDPAMFEMYRRYLGLPPVSLSMTQVHYIDRSEVDWQGCGIGVYLIESLPEAD